MDQFPLFITLHERRVLVVGGGPVAARKVRSIIDGGAAIHVIAPSLCDSLAKLVTHEKITHDARTYQPGDAKPFWLTVAATNDSAVNLQVAEDAHSVGALVNVADTPKVGNVSFASIVDRAPLQIAISTGGHSPILARLLRARIAAFIPKSYGALAQMAGDYRDRIKARFDSLNERRRFWEAVLTGPIARRLLTGDEEGARAQLEASLQLHPQQSSLTESDKATDYDAALIHNSHQEHTGEVYLVGAGPGDPDLLTFRALRLMHQADVVLHDRLVSDDVLALCPPEAEYVYVGKRRADHAMPQDTINDTLVKYAKAGKRVLRLKGGDPFIFGRGGEEIETLADAKVHFEVVPGITAAAGCASYAGIPLTHRDHAQACVFVTGHLKAGELHLNWQHLVQPNQTVVCYMGLTALAELCQKLQSHGLAADTPAALVERGTTQHQRVFTSTVSELPTQVANASVKAPTLIIIGSVVTLHEKLRWFAPWVAGPQLTGQLTQSSTNN